MRSYKEEIAARLAPLTGLPPQEIEHSLTLPQHEGHGDFSFPCFPLAKERRQPPAAIARELAQALGSAAPFPRVEAVGGYLNFHVDRLELAARTLTAVATQGDHYGDSRHGAGRTVILDFSSPNMGKELAFHHLRGTMLGNSLSRIYRKAGYRVVRINHLGDWGTSYGKLIVMFQREGLGEADLPGLTIARLNALYKSFADAASDDPSLEDQAREVFQRLEAGDPAYLTLWEAFKRVTLAELLRLYAILEVEFDSFEGEAFFVGHMPRVMGLLEAKGLVTKSQGAEIVDLSAAALPPVLLRKSDGATLYITRDIAAALHRRETYAFDKTLYVVDNGQSLHFQQLAKVLEMLGCPWHQDLVHVAFGLVLIKAEDGGWERGKTRAGASSLLKDVLEAACGKILGIIEEKNPEARGKADLAQRIAVGALVFSELKNRRTGDIRFEWDKALSFEGDSGPYVQNAHVRLSSILRKAAGRSGGREPDPPSQALKGIDFGKYPEPQAQALISTLARFPDRLAAALAADDPCTLAQYALEVAEGVHGFLHVCRVLDSAEAKERLLLVAASRGVLRQTLELIGVPAIEEM